MPALRQRLKRPQPYLALYGLLLSLAVLDSFRPPADQVTARIYEASVQAYQQYGRPISKRFIRCRYQPTCSEYSLQAVARHGIWRGLRLTIHRLASCTNAVPFGTSDPVPTS